MAGSSEHKRTQHGLTKLRDRFVRRAAYLTRCPEFLASLEAARQQWIAHYPDYPIKSDERIRLEPPPALMAEEARDHQEALDSLEPGDWLLPGMVPSVPVRRWNALVGQIIDRYWPSIDFSNPLPPERHPTTGFVTACLYRDPQDFIPFTSTVDVFREDLQFISETFFPQITLTVEPMLPTRGEYVLDRDFDEGEDLWWCIPLYPEMARADLVHAIPDIIRELDSTHYRELTPSARIVALSEQGSSRREISERLGIDIDTVKATLRIHRRTQASAKG